MSNISNVCRMTFLCHLNLLRSWPFGFTLTPFATKSDLCVAVSCRDSTFGFCLATNTASNPAYLSEILSASTAEKLSSSARVSCHKYIGAFVTAVDDIPVYTAAEASSALCKLANATNCPSHISLTLTPEPLPSSCNQEAALKELNIFTSANSNDDSDKLLTIHALRAIHCLHTTSSHLQHHQCYQIHSQTCQT